MVLLIAFPSFFIIFFPSDLITILIFLSISSLVISVLTLALLSPNLIRSAELLVRKDLAKAVRYIASTRLVLPWAFSPTMILRLASKSSSRFL